MKKQGKITDRMRINYIVAVGGGPYRDALNRGWWYLPKDWRGCYTGPHKTWRMATDAAIRAGQRGKM